jgi:pimeloyl-ACP methyl ester carboxylesterase
MTFELINQQVSKFRRVLKGQKEVGVRWARSDQEQHAYIKRAPIGTVHQAVALAETNIHHTVRALQETHGIPVGLIAAERDTLYPIYRRMGKVSKETGIPRDQMTVIPGTHITHLEDAKRVTSTINDMFLMLRKKRRGEQNGKSDVGGKSLV